MSKFEDSWSQSIRDMRKVVEKNIQGVGELGERFWLDVTRKQIATKAPPAPRSSWLADTVKSRDGVSLVVGWNDFRGSKDAADRRYEKALLHFDALLDRLIKNADLFRGA